MAIQQGYSPQERSGHSMTSQSQFAPDISVWRRRIAFVLFWAGAVFAVAFAAVAGRSLIFNLRTLTMAELNQTIWAEGGPLYILWALSVTVGSILAGVGALLYVKSKPIFIWIASAGVLVTVIAMVMFWTRVYSPLLFGIGGTITLLSFFALVWVWMRTYAARSNEQKVAASLKLLGFIFWINATWFICGETGKMHLKVFEGASAPSPIEVMVFLVLGWLFVLAGEYKTMQIATHPTNIRGNLR
jgi:hypothetical protein